MTLLGIKPSLTRLLIGGLLSVPLRLLLKVAPQVEGIFCLESITSKYVFLNKQLPPPEGALQTHR